jgi:hypothetical protein
MCLRIGSFGAVAALLVCTLSPASATADTVQRHLVYSFTYGNQSDLEVHSSGIDPGGGASGSSGMSDFTGGLSDQGTISVDVLSQQPDGGLVLKVSEQAQHTRSAAPATCVAYPNTGVICDPNATVNPEEMALIRLLAPKFVDPDNLDAAKHWKIEEPGAQMSVTSDFTIARNQGGMMTIDETRTVRQQGSQTVTTNLTTTISYDFNRSIPIAVNEYAIARGAAGMGQYNTTKSQTVLQLRSDSAATASAKP